MCVLTPHNFGVLSAIKALTTHGLRSVPSRAESREGHSTQEAGGKLSQVNRGPMQVIIIKHVAKTPLLLLLLLSLSIYISISILANRNRTPRFYVSAKNQILDNRH